MTNKKDQPAQKTDGPEEREPAVGLKKLTLCRTYTLAQFDVRFLHRLLDPNPLRSPAELARELVREGFIELHLDPTVMTENPSNKDRCIIIFAKDCLFLLEEDQKMIELENPKLDA